MKKFYIFFIGLLILSSCGNNIEKDTAKILVTYNEAIAKHFQKLQEIDEISAEGGWSQSEQTAVYGVNWRQKNWDKIRSESIIDSLENNFFEKYGEHEYNILSIKVSDNFKNKMK